MTPELSEKIDYWRKNEKNLTLKEMREAVEAIRGDRKAAATKSESASRTRAKKEIPNADDLLDQLGKL